MVEAEVWELLEEIPDPEIPVISLVDLGVVREIEVQNGRVRVDFTPTFLGCPALEVMRDAMADRIRSLGADPVELPYGQVLTGLATKLVDGAENNWPSFVTTDHYKYAGHYTLTEHTMSPEVLVMSLKAWETLSPDDRKIFREEARRSGQFMREKWRDLEERSRKQAETAGVRIVTDLDRKPFEAAMAGIYVKVQQDPAMAQLIERIRKVE